MPYLRRQFISQREAPINLPPWGADMSWACPGLRVQIFTELSLQSRMSGVCSSIVNALNLPVICFSQWTLIFFSGSNIKPLNPELNPICYLLALLGAHHFLHVSRIRVKILTFRRLMSYMHGAPILDVSRSHTTTQHSR